MVQSKFNRGTLVKIAICLLLMIILLLAMLLLFRFDSVVNIALMGLVIFIFGFFFTWIIYGECRTKALQANIDPDRIAIRNYFGLGAEKVFYFSELQGFKIDILSTEYTDYEYLYLLRNSRKVITFSELYHANYEEIKDRIISSGLKFLGNEKFNIGKEIREIFT